MIVRQDWHREEIELLTNKPHGLRVKYDMNIGRLLYFPEEQDDVEELLDEESFSSSEED